MFTDYTTKVDSEPPNGSNDDITNPYECDQTLNVGAGTANLSADDQEKSKVIEESDSTIPDPSHQTLTSTPSVIAPFTDVSSTKPSSLVTPPPINTEATTITTFLPEITPFIALQLRSIKNQESEKSPKEIIRIKREQGEEKQDSTYSIRSIDKVAFEEFDLKSALFKRMNKNKTANRNPANYHLYHALMEALIADEDAMDKEVTFKVKENKRKHDSDDDEDDDDDEGPSAGSNQGRSAERRRPEFATSGSAQPPPKDDDQSLKKPWESDASASKQHPTLTSTGWYSDYLLTCDIRAKNFLSISKLKAARYLDFGLEELVPSLWVESECEYDISAVYGITHWWFRRKEILLQQTKSSPLIVKQSDRRCEFSVSVPTQYSRKAQHLPKTDKTSLHTAVNMWIRNLVIRNRVGDLQLGIESYQTKINLERPNWDAADYYFKEDYTIVPKPRAVVYRDRNDQRKLMRLNELHKFSDGTLTRVMEKLDHMVKDFHLFEYNKGMESRKWSEDDKRRSKDFITAIEKRLQIRRIFRSLESFVGGRIRDIDYRLINRTT
ncbi:hypothetical protein Tco_0618405 [Tanacetum coccineum]